MRSVGWAWFVGLVGLVANLGTADEPQTADQRPPNIVLIMIDDMSFDWVGAYGGQGKTPRIDQLAREGLRFETCWCTPICTPTRMMLLTGRYPFRTGWIEHHDVPRWGGRGFDWEREICWARPVREAGYRTGIAGKWQINDLRVHPDALDRHGFDEHCMWPGYETGNPPSYERYWNGYYVTNGQRQVHEGRFGPDVANEFVRDFVRRHHDRPFLLYYPMNLTHSPYDPIPAEDGTPREEPLHGSRFADMVAYSDTLIGRLLDTLDELQIADNTVVIFTCDNGSSVGGRVGDVRFPSGKGKMTFAGVRVPLIVRWPGVTPKNATTAAITDFTDLYPTLVEIAGGTLPGNVTLDGRSLVPVLTGERDSTGREWIYSQRDTVRVVSDGYYKLDSTGDFWDVRRDPTQSRNLANSDNAEVVAARQRLQAVLEGLPEDGPPPFAGYRQRRGGPPATP